MRAKKNWLNKIIWFVTWFTIKKKTKPWHIPPTRQYSSMEHAHRCHTKGPGINLSINLGTILELQQMDDFFQDNQCITISNEHSYGNQVTNRYSSGYHDTTKTMDTNMGEFQVLEHLCKFLSICRLDVDFKFCGVNQRMW